MEKKKKEADSKRLKALEFGRFAEQKVCEEYIKQGCVILERNWRLGKTEIDIISQDGNEVIMIEVKARGGLEEEALNAVTIDKRRRMVKAADAFLRGLKGEYSYRFDIVAVTGDMENYNIEIHKDAFLAADLF